MKNVIFKSISILLTLALTSTTLHCNATKIVSLTGGGVSIPPSAPVSTSMRSKNSAGTFSLQAMKSKIDEVINPQKGKAEPRETYSGTCGDKVNWNFQPSTGTLTISGSGEMFSYADDTVTPWSSLKSSVTSVEIKEDITNIGANAFRNCDNLKSVSIPDSVINIEKWAFCGNQNLVSVSMGKNVHRLGKYSFGYCPKLKSISLNSVVSIEGSAFIECTNLESVSFGNTLKTIGQNAFGACKSLSSVTIPNSVTYVGDWAFNSCDNLKTVVLGTTHIGYLGEAAFAYDTKLSSFTYLGSIGEEAQYVQEQFTNTPQLNSVTVPNNDPGTYTSFYGKPVVKSANLLSWSCGENVGCVLDTSSNKLTVSGFGKMYDYGSSDKIPWDSYKSTIKTLVIEEGVTSISEGAFKGFSKITSVVIPNSVKSIGKSAFEQCSKLSGVTLGNGVNTIGQNAFSNCNMLNVLNIPKSVSFIGSTAFSGCNNIHTVTYLGNSDPGKTSSHVFSSPYLSYVNVPSNYDSSKFCGKSVKKNQQPVVDSSSSSSDICNCDKSENCFKENMDWMIPMIVTSIVSLLGNVVSIVIAFCSKDCKLK